MEEDVVAMQDVFRFVHAGVDDQGRVMGRFTATGIRPRVIEKLDEFGLEMPKEIVPIFHESVRPPQ